MAICEDEYQMSNIIHERIAALFASRGLAYDVDAFTSGEALFASGKDVTKYDIVFLDVHMSVISGIDVAREIRHRGGSAQVVFVSGIIEAAPLGYEVNAFRYIVKDEKFDERFSACVNTIIDTFLAPTDTFVFKVQDNKISVLISEIAFFESQLRKMAIHVADSEESNYTCYTFYSKIADIETQLAPKGFIRIHKGYLINPAKIAQFKARFLIMDNGTELPISSARHSEVKRQYLKWKAGYGI